MYKHILSARDALNIAAQYGFSVRGNRKLIRDGIIQARAACSRPRIAAPYIRRKNAIQHFDGYMAAAAESRKATR